MGRNLQDSRPYPLTVFYDGDCPLCAREIALFKRLNRNGMLSFVDFASASYDPQATGLDPSDLGRVIHARWADRTTITGVEVFRAMWEAVGLRWLACIARLRMIDWVLVRGYAWFARNRLWLTGRSRGTRTHEHEQRGAGFCKPCAGSQRQGGEP